MAEIDDEVWTTRDGREIPVRDLQDEHCRNILRMLLRKRRERMAVYAAKRHLALWECEEIDWEETK